jgi:hypothetical protein
MVEIFGIRLYLCRRTEAPLTFLPLVPNLRLNSTQNVLLADIVNCSHWPFCSIAQVHLPSTPKVFITFSLFNKPSHPPKTNTMASPLHHQVVVLAIFVALVCSTILLPTAQAQKLRTKPQLSFLKK